MHRLARVMVLVGVLLAVLGLSKVHAVVNGYDLTDSSRFAWALGYAAVLVVAAYGFGIPDVPRRRRVAFGAAVGAAAVAALAVSFAQLAVGDALLPRAVVFGVALVIVPWFALWTRIAHDARTRAERRERVVVVGDLDEVDMLVAELARAPERPAVVVASLTPGAARPFKAVDLPRVDHSTPDLPLVDAVHGSHATLLVLDRAAQSDEEVVLQAARLHEEGVRVRTLSLFYEQWLGKLPISELERVSLLFDVGELHTRHYARVKRILDVALALVGLVALAAVTPLVAIGDALGNRGSLLFRQPRVGRDEQTFTMLKFRTMRTEQDSDELTAEHDPRVTPFGAFLRRTHLDELPQLLNVLRGDLSLVGPRPEQPRVVAQLEGKIPLYRLRHLVRPGITGWAQVKYPYAATDAEALEKLQYEFFYLRHQSLPLDARIVARTIRSVTRREGR